MNESRIVVAYIGTVSSEAALEWAARYAHRTIKPITLVSVDDGTTVLPEQPLTEEIETSTRKLETRAERIRKQYPGLEVTCAVARGEVLNELTALSGPSSLLVIGAGEHHILRHPARWSLCVRLVTHAPGPVVVVPVPTGQHRSGVLVGVDGSEDSPLLVDYAAHLATALMAGLRIVHAWLPPVMVLNPYPLDAATVALVEEPHQRFTTDLTVAAQQAHPGLQVTGVSVRGHPAAAFITADPRPELVVVGRRRRSMLQRTLLGSTSRDAILNADAPTIVVPLESVAPGRVD